MSVFWRGSASRAAPAAEMPLMRAACRFASASASGASTLPPPPADSQGLRQTLPLSAAPLHDPAIIVFDEPNSGLDVTSSLVLRSLVQELASSGKIIIYSSHMLEAVEKICHDVVILHRSHVVACNSVARLRETTRSGTLEEVFAAVAVDQDVEQVGRDIVDVGTL